MVQHSTFHYILLKPTLQEARRSIADGESTATEVELNQGDDEIERPSAQPRAALVPLQYMTGDMELWADPHRRQHQRIRQAEEIWKEKQARYSPRS